MKLDELYNYLLIVSYIGINYEGWQKQKDFRNTIQEILINAIEKVFNTKIIKCSYTGRTDKGVSALFQYFNIYINTKIELTSRIIQQINSILPESIRILHLISINNSFNSRYNVKYKTYIYKIIPSDNYNLIVSKYNLKNFLLINRIPKEDIILLLNNFVKFFNGVKDYSSYYKPEKGIKKNTVIDLETSYFIYDFPEFFVVNLQFKATYFLRNMIRKIVGMLCAYLENKISLDYIEDSFREPSASKGKFLAPPEPLVLYLVKY